MGRLTAAERRALAADLAALERALTRRAAADEAAAVVAAVVGGGAVAGVESGEP